MQIRTLIEKARKEFTQERPETSKKYKDDTYTVHGFERDHQAQINLDPIRHFIAASAGIYNVYPEFIQVFGDSQTFTHEGTMRAKSLLVHLVMNAHPNSLILFGLTGKKDVDKQERLITETNYLVSHLMDENIIKPNRVIGNMVDYHTGFAIKEWGSMFSDKINHFTLVYSNTAEPETVFGKDTPITDGLTNTAGVCFDGGVQSLLQALNLLERGIPVFALTDLRDLSDKTNRIRYDLSTGKPYLSAAGILEYLKTNLTQEQQPYDKTTIQKLLDAYFLKFSLTSPTARDASTKKELWEQAVPKLLNPEILANLDKFKLVNSVEQLLQDNVDVTVKASLASNL